MTSSLPGRATPEATKAYADRMWKADPQISPDSWRLAGDLTVGKIGFGAYRVNGAERQEEALVEALNHGVNLIDTASNYMDGESESLIGEVLAQQVETGTIKREEVVLVTKGGYLQGSNLERFRAHPPPEVVPVAEHLWHCIHPAFLKDQITHSLERLGVECVDIYLIHNPEYYLEYLVQENGEVTENDRAEFYRRLQDAFVLLEKMVMEGKIGCYGLSANGLVLPTENAICIDLARVLEAADFAAQEAWGRRKRSSFRCVQMPFNLLEPEAVQLTNTTAKVVDGEENVSPLELASRAGLTVLINRPLNAFAAGSPFRLAEGPTTLADSIPEAMEEVRQVEDQISETLGGWPALNDEPLASVADIAEQVGESYSNSIHTDHYLMNALQPQAAMMIHALIQMEQQADEGDPKAKTLANLREAYFLKASRLFSCLRHLAHRHDAEILKPIEMELRERLDEDWRGEPIQRVALNAIASTPGVSCVLCGLRQPEYLKDVTALYHKGGFPDVAGILGAA